MTQIHSHPRDVEASVTSLISLIIPIKSFIGTCNLYLANTGSNGIVLLLLGRFEFKNEIDRRANSGLLSGVYFASNLWPGALYKQDVCAQGKELKTKTKSIWYELIVPPGNDLIILWKQMLIRCFGGRETKGQS